MATKTRSRQCKAEELGKGFTIKWNAELWMPVWVPNKTNTIAVGLYDRDLFGDDDLVAMLPPMRYDRLQCKPEYFKVVSRPAPTGCFGHPTDDVRES